MSTNDTNSTGNAKDADMEQLLREAMDSRARQAVPDDRRPPPMVWADVPKARRAWVTPLAIAASVAVVAGGIGLAVAPHREATPPPATQSSTPTVSSTPTTAPSTGTPTGDPTTGAAPTGGATTSGSTGATTGATTGGTASATTGAGSRVDFAGGVITLPTGWQGEVRPPRTGESGLQYLCIGPAASSLPSAGECVISVAAVSPPQLVDADNDGGLVGNPQYCGVGSPTTSAPLREYRDVVIGGRTGEYRRWVYDCKDGTSGPTIEQYQVATPLSVVITSRKADQPGVHEAITSIATEATLPAATSSTRLYDHGILRSVTPGANGSFVLSVDRVIVGWPNGSPTTYDYTLPGGQTGSLADPTALVGKTVAVFTDGTDVVQLYAEN